jgi:hypothetical protein
MYIPFLDIEIKSPIIRRKTVTKEVEVKGAIDSVTEEAELSPEVVVEQSAELRTLAVKSTVDIIQTQESYIADSDTAQLPTSGGRLTEPVDANLLGTVKGFMSTVTPDSPIEYLNVLKKLAMFNGDVSFAVDNIVQLGNTEYEIEFNDGIDPVQAAKMLNELRYGQRKVYSGGLNSLINDLLAQAAISGAISAEIVPERALTDVKEIVLVDPATIRFVYNSKKRSYDTYQEVDASAMKKVDVNGNMIKLNTRQYKYYALRRFSEKPYAIPPFLSALEDISREHTIMCGLDNIVKKLGILGFLSVVVTPPKAMQGENKEAYQTRCLNYLKSIAPEVEKGFNNGIAIGFKGVHEFDMKSTTADVDGAMKIIDLITKRKHSGLKQDSLLLNGGEGVTGDMATVVMEKLKTQVKNYQALVAAVLEDYFAMKLLMKGYKFKHIKVCFAPPMLGDAMKKEMAYETLVNNMRSLYADGVISQDGRARALGFEKPDKPEPRVPIDAYNYQGNQKSTGNPTGSNKKDPVDKRKTKKVNPNGKNTAKKVKQAEQ